MLSMVVNDRQNNWNLHLSHVMLSYNNSVNAATGLSPNELHLGRYPRLPITVFERHTFDGHQGLDQDQMSYHALARARQRKAFTLVREQHAINASRIERSNTALYNLMHKRPTWKVGDWVWVYNSQSTIRQGTDRSANETALKTKLSLNWTGPFKILTVGPSSSSPDGKPVGDKLLYLDLPRDLRGHDAKSRVSVQRCKPCINPHDASDMPKYLPAGLTQYVLNSYSTKSPPYHVTTDDVTEQPLRLAVSHISGH